MSWGYLEDASGMQGHADRIVAPRDEFEAQELVRAATAQRIPLTIAGAGSGLAGGRVPQGGWLLSMEKFTQLEIGNGFATAGAGVPLAELHAAARRSNQFYPPDPTETSAAIGGTIACNSSGSRSFLYGATRNWVQSLRVLFMDGSIRDVGREEKIDFETIAVQLPRSSKHSCGYLLQPGMSLMDLIIGSEGTLAIVLSAKLSLLPNPKTLLNGIVFFATDEACINAVEAWRSVPGLRMLEYVDGPSLRLIHSRYPEIPAHANAAIIMEQIVESETVFDEWADRVIEFHGFEEESWFGTSDADRERFRRFRHALPEAALDKMRQNGFPKLGTDYAVPHERNREMLAYYRRRLDEELPQEAVVFGHIGNAHVHVNMLPATEEGYRKAKALFEEFAQKAAALEGSVAAEHGLGKRKKHLLPLQYSATEISAMQKVKQRFDPHWLLGQGTLFDRPE
jgi:FAD/FMN-containing dehydrogenase